MIASIAAKAMGRSSGYALRPETPREVELVNHVRKEEGKKVERLKKALQRQPGGIAAALDSDEQLVKVAEEYMESVNAAEYPFRPRPLQCSGERSAFLQCMSTNNSDILRCSSAVRALSDCSQRASGVDHT